MKVLFVSSGNNRYGISPIIKNQGDSLVKEGVEVDYFTIKGKGLKGYIKAIFELREYLKNNHYDIIHAHYWLSGISAALSGAKPLVVSLMGDDVKANGVFRAIVSFFHSFFWDKTIVKSKDMYKSFGKKDVAIIPNGVDLEKFRPIEKKFALEVTGWDENKRHILFTANPKREVKNFALTKEAFELLNSDEIELHALVDIPNEKVPFFYNSADVVVMSSLWEGSPNAIKEAMACNIPIVSTDVGDVKDVIGDTKGCYVSSANAREFAYFIKEALAFKGRTNGREHVRALSSLNIAQVLIALYNRVLKGK